MDVQCNTALEEAMSRFEKAGDVSQDAQRNEKIANLITAARIEQQQGRFAPCLDRAQRALTLLQPTDAN